MVRDMRPDKNKVFKQLFSAGDEYELQFQHISEASGDEFFRGRFKVRCKSVPAEERHSKASRRSRSQESRGGPVLLGSPGPRAKIASWAAHSAQLKEGTTTTDLGISWDKESPRARRSLPSVARSDCGKKANSDDCEDEVEANAFSIHQLDSDHESRRASRSIQSLSRAWYMADDQEHERSLLARASAKVQVSHVDSDRRDSDEEAEEAQDQFSADCRLSKNLRWCPEVGEDQRLSVSSPEHIPQTKAVHEQETHVSGASRQSKRLTWSPELDKNERSSLSSPQHKRIPTPFCHPGNRKSSRDFDEVKDVSTPSVQSEIRRSQSLGNMQASPRKLSTSAAQEQETNALGVGRHSKHLTWSAENQRSSVASSPHTENMDSLSQCDDSEIVHRASVESHLRSSLVESPDKALACSEKLPLHALPEQHLDDIRTNEHSDGNQSRHGTESLDEAENQQSSSSSPSPTPSEPATGRRSRRQTWSPEAIRSGRASMSSPTPSERSSGRPLTRHTWSPDAFGNRQPSPPISTCRRIPTPMSPRDRETGASHPDSGASLSPANSQCGRILTSMSLPDREASAPRRDSGASLSPANAECRRILTPMSLPNREAGVPHPDSGASLSPANAQCRRILTPMSLRAREAGAPHCDSGASVSTANSQCRRSLTPTSPPDREADAPRRDSGASLSPASARCRRTPTPMSPPSREAGAPRRDSRASLSRANSQCSRTLTPMSPSDREAGAPRRHSGASLSPANSQCRRTPTPMSPPDREAGSPRHDSRASLSAASSQCRRILTPMSNLHKEIDAPHSDSEASHVHKSSLDSTTKFDMQAKLDPQADGSSDESCVHTTASQVEKALPSNSITETEQATPDRANAFSLESCTTEERLEHRSSEVARNQQAKRVSTPIEHNVGHISSGEGRKDPAVRRSSQENSLGHDQVDRESHDNIPGPPSRLSMQAVQEESADKFAMQVPSDGHSESKECLAKTHGCKRASARHSTADSMQQDFRAEHGQKISARESTENDEQTMVGNPQLAEPQRLSLARESANTKDVLERPAAYSFRRADCRFTRDTSSFSGIAGTYFCGISGGADQELHDSCHPQAMLGRDRAAVLLLLGQADSTFQAVRGQRRGAAADAPLLLARLSGELAVALQSLSENHGIETLDGKPLVLSLLARLVEMLDTLVPPEDSDAESMITESLNPGGGEACPPYTDGVMHALREALGSNGFLQQCLVCLANSDLWQRLHVDGADCFAKELRLLLLLAIRLTMAWDPPRSVMKPEEIMCAFQGPKILIDLAVQLSYSLHSPGDPDAFHLAELTLVFDSLRLLLRTGFPASEPHSKARGIRTMPPIAPIAVEVIQTVATLSVAAMPQHALLPATLRLLASVLDLPGAAASVMPHRVAQAVGSVIAAQPLTLGLVAAVRGLVTDTERRSHWFTQDGKLSKLKKELRAAFDAERVPSQLAIHAKQHLQKVLMHESDMCESHGLSQKLKQKAARVMFAGLLYDQIEAVVLAVYGSTLAVDEMVELKSMRAELQPASDSEDGSIGGISRRPRPSMVAALHNMRQAIYDSCLVPQARE